MKNIIRLTVIAATLLALAMPTFAATPKQFYKPVKIPKIPNISVNVKVTISDSYFDNLFRG